MHVKHSAIPAPTIVLSVRREDLVQTSFHIGDLAQQDLDGFRDKLLRLVLSGRFDAICNRAAYQYLSIKNGDVHSHMK